ncbi:hypothetical protein DFH11DRAFT_1509987 [Phellopilus nigrolimitatus]|nr:hypothetical protein DFH11DRAFT_1509987 [Phellopilus nigrolimitatus]
MTSFLGSTLTLTAAPSTKRNKLRRRRPSPPRAMSVVATGAGPDSGPDSPPATLTPPASVVASDSPTLHDPPSDDGDASGDARDYRDSVHARSPPPPPPPPRDPDDPQALVIASLRTQIQDLISQVTQLNGKLVSSYDRVSDLEDELHLASAAGRATALTISALEIERAQHLAALNTGLYVEKAHVTAELTRLMERATDEAAARGQAESARHNIEHELDDLSANLFGQANTMVAEARFGRALAERKVVDAEAALRSAEEAVGLMQLQVQALRDEKDRTADDVVRLRALMAKGKFVEHPPVVSSAVVRLLSSHSPYQEFLLFITHLRSVRPASLSPPHISTLLPLPFLARLQTEDSDPTVRLDFAPSLNWLSRRSVLSAIYSGQLTIEPMSASVLLLELSSSLQSMIPGSQTGLSCALCGTHIFPPRSEYLHAPPPSHPLSTLSLTRHANSSTWSTSLFKNPLANNSASAAPSPPPTPPPHDAKHTATATSAASNPSPSSPAQAPTVYVFRLAQAHTPPQHAAQAQKPTNYPLCGSGWCLARLRTTCSLWAFVRAGVVDRVWEEAPSAHGAPAVSASSASVYSNASTALVGREGEKAEAPPLPPRRRSKISSVGSLWGALRGQSQPASPVHTAAEKERKSEEGEAPATPETDPELELPPKQRAASLSVAVPPPLPRRSVDRGAGGRPNGHGHGNESGSGSGGEEKPATGGGDDANSDSQASEKTPVALAGGALPPAEHIAPSVSQASSAQSGSGAGDEFTTPVEEFTPLPLTFATPPRAAAASASASAPSPPGSPRAHVRRTSRSPPPSFPPLRSPRSPTRASTPPRSPRAVPLPDSRPGTPALKTHSRAPSAASAAIAPLNIAGATPSSRAASPSPASAGAPPVPKRAAARRAVPPPPPPSGGAASAPPHPPAAAEKGEASEASPRTSTDAARPGAPPPPLPARAQLSVAPVSRADASGVSDYGDGDADALGEKQARRRAGGAGDGEGKLDGNARAGADLDADARAEYVGEATWEERTWRELVRLREDMYWARVGGVRG